MNAMPKATELLASIGITPDWKRWITAWIDDETGTVRLVLKPRDGRDRNTDTVRMVWKLADFPMIERLTRPSI